MKKLIYLTLIMALTIPLYAGDKDGTSTAVFLRMEQGVRALGMGGAFVAIDADAESVWWNPAGAASIDATQLNFAYSDYVSDIIGSYVAFVLPRGRNLKASLIGSVNYISIGTFEARDASNVSLGSKKLNNMVISIGYSMITAPNLSVGVLAKNVQQNLGDDKATAYAGDVGCLFKISEILSLGFAVQNIGTKMKTDTAENPIPMNMRLGTAYKISPKVMLSAEGEMPNDADMRIHIGTEMKMSQSFSLRAGYNSSSAVGFSAGVGVLTPLALKPKKTGEGTSTWWKEAVDKDWKHNVARIDYAYVSNGTLDATHRISLTLKF